METRRGRRNMPLPYRAITLGELLFREEHMHDMRPPPPRPMSRIMSQTRRLGPLANGRPRRPRGRTMTRPSTSTGQADDDTQARRRRAPVSIPALTRWRSATTENRIQSMYGVMSSSGSRQARRQGNSRTTRPRHHSVAGRPESPDLFYNPFGWQRNNSAGRQAQSRPRSNTNSIPRSGPLLQGHFQRVHRSIIAVPVAPPSMSGRVNVYDAHLVHRISPYRTFFSYPRQGANSASTPSRYLRSIGRPRTAIGRPNDPDARRNTPNGRARSEMSPSVQRFVDFAAEFIPAQPHAPDAEPPEWSLDTTPADFGPFAVGRSAVSRDRSLAMIAALSQIQDDTDSDN